MFKLVFLVLLSMLVYTTQADGTVLKGDGGRGEPCEMGGSPGVAGTCKEVSACLRDGDEFKREGQIKLCHQGEPDSDILVCSRNSDIIAEKLCDEWKKYWNIDQRRDCVQENQLIFGGEEASIGEFPYIARVGIQRGENIDWECGGTLISPHFILSAAHCFRCTIRNDPEQCNRWDEIAQYWVRLGDHNANEDKTIIDRIWGTIPTSLYQSEALTRDTATEGPVEQEIKAKRIIRHPEYDEEFRYFDIALIELEKPAMFTQRVLPACLQYNINPYDLEGVKGLINETISVAGWGNTEDMTMASSPVLMKVSLNVTEILACYPSFPAHGLIPIGLMEDHLCAVGDIGQGSCTGDSGGPAVYQPDGDCEHHLVGVVSFGNAGCTEYEIFARVYSYLGWITSYIAPNA